jgi:hypothetical protein
MLEGEVAYRHGSHTYLMTPGDSLYFDADAPHGPEELRRLSCRYLSTVLTLELQTLARACWKSHVLNLEPEDLVALTVEAAAMAQVPLAGTNWIPGRGAY